MNDVKWEITQDEDDYKSVHEISPSLAVILRNLK